MDFVDIQAVLQAFELQGTARVMLVDGRGLVSAHVPSFPPDAPAVLFALQGLELSALLRPLMAVYPPGFALSVLGVDGGVKSVPLAALGGDSAVALLVPALGQGTSFEAFQELIAHLRAPEDGCPWDKKQTHHSLRKHLLEESYETISAMDEMDAAKMREEFGDLLLQIVLNAQIAVEANEFNMAGVLAGIYDKIVRRHPHVFGEVAVNGVDQVLSNWEAIKAEERKKNGEEEKGALDGLPASLPALSQAQEIQERAARLKFDWPEIDGVLDKVREEIVEVRNTTNMEDLVDEMGDLFFTLVALARWKNVDSESALRAASRKFAGRFKYLEARARQAGRMVHELDSDEMDVLWVEAKQVLSSRQ